ncbi:hypothetical protein MMC13_007519 [Lambiella insularis]|nr:hypothetical protein [Lambiella insularis]
MDKPRKALTEPWDRQALCFFMSDRSIVPKHLVVDKFSIATIMTPICIDTYSDSALMSILSSISLFSLSHVQGHERLAIAADRHYAEAVSPLNTAIADPVACKRNDTLLCVLLFQLRELITMTESSIATWRQHSDGAIALCKIRGTPRNALERRLYAATRDLMMSRRLLNLERIPRAEIESLWTLWPFDEDPYHYDPWTETTLKILNLRAEAYKLLHEPMSASAARALLAISGDAKALDLRIQKWTEDLTASGFYETLFTFTGPLLAHTNLSKMELWPGAIDLYSDLGKAHAWNIYRSHRIMVLMVIINCAERLSSPAELAYSVGYRDVVQTIVTLANE